MMRPAMTLLLAIFLLVPRPALAHKVTVFAWIEAGTVYTESKFSGGKRVQSGKIEVRDHDHRLVAEGATDKNGRFSFEVPQGARTLDVILTAGMGHTNHWIVTAEELGIAAPIEYHWPPAANPTADDKTIALDADTVEKIVQRSIERQLAPLKAQLADQAWGLRDIVAGLGYILGLMGLASYMHHRQSRGTPPGTKTS